MSLKNMERIKRVYFLYELYTGTHMLRPQERYLFTGVLATVLAFLAFKLLY